MILIGNLSAILPIPQNRTVNYVQAHVDEVSSEENSCSDKLDQSERCHLAFCFISYAVIFKTKKFETCTCHGSVLKIISDVMVEFWKKNKNKVLWYVQNTTDSFISLMLPGARESLGRNVWHSSCTIFSVLQFYKKMYHIICSAEPEKKQTFLKNGM